MMVLFINILWSVAMLLAEARFSAYARGVVSYIVESTHPDNPDIRGTYDFKRILVTRQLQYKLIRAH